MAARRRKGKPRSARRAQLVNGSLAARKESHGQATAEQGEGGSDNSQPEEGVALAGGGEGVA